MPSARQFISRLPFTFFALAALLVWEIYQIQSGRVPPQPAWRVGLYVIGAAFGILLGILGLRERHRQLRDRMQ